MPLVPRSTLSIWNRVQVAPLVGRRRGRRAPGAACTRRSTTPSRCPPSRATTRALYVTLPLQTRAQLNVENLLDARYYPTSHGNNNIMPGASRTLRLSLIADF